MNVLSLFDGMSCGRIALRELGIEPEHYYASEIDKFAISQTRLNFPDTIHLGDVTKWREWEIDWGTIDLILAGSPCQGFSFAGKQLAFDDPRSKLFFVFVDILNHVKALNPDVFFLLENVNMKKEHMRVITEYCGVHPVNINSNLVSAQNRNRWYWTNIRTRKVGLFGEIHSDIPQPKDEGILLRDILEEEVDEKYYLSEKAIRYISNDKRMEKRFTQIDGDKAPCLLAGGHGAGNHSDMDLILQRPRGNNKGNVFRGKAPTLSSNAWEQNNVLHRIIQLNESKESGGIQPYQQNRVYDANGQCPALLAEISGRSHAILSVRQKRNLKDQDGKSSSLLASSYKGSQANGMTLVETSSIRRLTPIECSRLQTVPDWYKWDCSDTQIYRLLGNGWTIKVIRHILSFLKKDIHHS
ncbi:DNA (cytosine-5-)-methyltransferase [Parabacteroides distasonis]|jgi:DNA (cytosine-5)-methyltransferase 3A|uniref:DNA (cytosine-5-)-methyltransferase n=1 Tax=Parabacteroides distasonis TaxID=823 RepID=A0AAX3QWN5_PARDI|nr:DNA (cytosine-5-)-methyltransferase [Parabacteroides distasonis]WET65450.1 DNA (cytosine-5-)-methyltransferase [Parabacteroides distasonis]